MTPFTCPISAQIQAHQNSIQNLSQSMIQSLRHLRNELYQCNQCANLPDCQFRQDLSANVNIAVTEIADELLALHNAKTL